MNHEVLVLGVYGIFSLFSVAVILYFIAKERGEPINKGSETLKEAINVGKREELVGRKEA